MQQRCTNCGSYLQPGAAVCSTCGTPVSSGGGAYDPTVRAGTPPGTGYGQQPYGSQPYGQQPYGSQPYGAPPPPPDYGAPPPPQPYGAPTPGFVGQPYGAPPMAPMAPPPQKKSRTIWYVLGGILAVLIIACGVLVYLVNAAGHAVVNGVNTLATQVAQTETAVAANQPFQQTSTTGTHITTIETGTGFDSTSGSVTGPTDTFHPGDQVYTVFTVDLQGASSAQVEIKYLKNNSQTATSGPKSLSDSNVYSYHAPIGSSTGVYTVEIDYNGAPEATITIDVVS